MRCVVSLVIGLALSAVPGSKANALTNGSFEVPPVPSGTWIFLPAGATNMPGWTVGGSGGDVVLMNRVGAWPLGALDGEQFVVFNAGNTAPGSTIAQRLDTVIGRQYAVAFHAGRNGDGHGVMQMTASVIAADQSVLESVVVTQDEAAWSDTVQFSFVATTETTFLVFEDTSAATIAVDLQLDGVSVWDIGDFVSIRLSHLEMCLATEPGVRYQIQYSTDPQSGAWFDLGSPFEATNDVTCILQEIVDGQSSRFYRAERLP